MTVDLDPYLNFPGDARAALEFYRSVFGGELTMSSFRDFGMPVAPEEAEQIMHGQLRTPSGMLLMGSDVPSSMPYTPGEHAFSVSLSGDDADALTGYWTALAEGATVQQPLEQAAWGGRFGMLVDRFGVAWLVNVSDGAAA